MYLTSISNGLLKTKCKTKKTTFDCDFSVFPSDMLQITSYNTINSAFSTRDLEDTLMMFRKPGVDK